MECIVFLNLKPLRSYFAVLSSSAPRSPIPSSCLCLSPVTLATSSAGEASRRCSHQIVRSRIEASASIRVKRAEIGVGSPCDINRPQTAACKQLFHVNSSAPPSLRPWVYPTRTLAAWGTAGVFSSFVLVPKSSCLLSPRFLPCHHGSRVAWVQTRSSLRIFSGLLQHPVSHLSLNLCPLETWEPANGPSLPWNVWSW